jgi:hypothetical protein
MLSKGLIWFLMATIAEVPPVVSLITPLVHLSPIHTRFRVGFYYLEPERYDTLHRWSGNSITNSALLENPRSFQSRTFPRRYASAGIILTLSPPYRCFKLPHLSSCQSPRPGCIALWQALLASPSTILPALYVLSSC